MLFLPIRGPRLAERLVRLVVGLLLFGAGSGLMLQSDLGLSPWDVLHQGLAIQLGLTVGAWTVIVAFVVLLLWLPLRERYGLGTLLNALIIGPAIDMTTAIVPQPDALPARAMLMVVGVVIVAIATGLYIGAHFGPGPRDGLMTGISKRGPSIRLTRAVIELTVLVLGWMLGGTVGVGTVVFAVAIGPLVQVFLPIFEVDLQD
ncbi:MAG TPA: hypothetical protein VLG28_13480 [Acidimicrobiia bacterium]|nr:hypothetical protein [Acidimicrobiia bacterium]